ncbi:D-alanyl-D-alanine carboxypeptidase family protein [Catenulispora rubra]|uniref:D-alanyl-D-alanine carboxypeptidase family protein n=1 Tax=Catenulispora rubra TaxID=280293 RepID=UPI0018924D26|nr:D-alanyl-D-alanine carboxypeptidase [Catenulispora rubra]
MRTPILRRRVARWGTAVLLAAVPATTAVPAEALPISPLPSTGQAALWFAGHSMTGGPVSTPQPIASVTKVMTAYQVLADHPLKPGDQGPTITVLASEVTAYRAARLGGESVIPVAAGERISEHTALEAMLLPSANDMARILARWDAGGISGFVSRMNATAALLGMRNTHYADPAGVNTATVSTATDQLRLDQMAMADPVLAGVVGEKSATVPVAGTVRNSNPLLGTDGFVGTKTGWTTAAGSCLMFAAREPDRHGGARMVYGVLLGQPGGPSSGAIFASATRMVNAARAGL